jgi:cation diffusion facilitator family transporter
MFGMNTDNDNNTDNKHEGKAIAAALAANAGVAIMKGLVAAFTGSASMLSEAIHSASDCGNEITLIIGKRVGNRKSSEKHPFGYSRARYIASLLVAILLFVLGGVYSVMQSWSKLMFVMSSPEARIVHPHELLIALGIVIVSAGLEGYSLRNGIMEAKAQSEIRGESWSNVLSFWKHTKSSELAAVLTEDILALIGLGLAALGIIVSLITGDDMFDAIGGVAIGILLIIGAFLLGQKSSSLLIGEGITDHESKLLSDAIMSDSRVHMLINKQCLHLAEDVVLINAKIEVNDEIHTDDGNVINTIEDRMRAAVPWLKLEIYIEVDKYDADFVSSPDAL